MITLEHIHKYYPSPQREIHALKDVNLSIKPGTIYGILGRSGAGKSTLLRCVNLLERPSSGRVLINNIDLLSLNKEQLRQKRHKIGMIFQHFNLLESYTVFKNIALPLEIIGWENIDIKQRVLSLLELVGLTEKANHYPSQLSGGQKQRVAIARALAAQAEILLCDEATSALDTEATHTILELLQKINREFNLTILLITHELDVIREICDYAGVLEHGELIEQAATVDLFANPQHPVTKQLIRKAFHLTPTEIDPLALPTDEYRLILQLTFIGQDSDTPFISYLVKQFDININIQHADLTQVHGKVVGYTICELSGKQENVQKALQFIKTTNIKAEELSHG